MMRWRRHKKQLALVIIVLTILTVIFFSRKEHGITSRPTAKGFLNVDIWEEICGYQMQSLKEFPLFPHGPSKRLRTSSLQFRFTQDLEDFGVRIFGFLSPSESGSYSFYLVSSGTTELWISSDSKPGNSKLIANTSAGIAWNYNNGNSKPLLAGRMYYLELLHKYGRQIKGKRHHVHVKWRSSSWREDKPREIPSDVLIAYENKSNGFDSEVIFPMQVKHHDHRFANERVRERSEMFRLPFVNESDSQDLFPPCRYNPSYLVKKPLKRYQSTWEMRYISIYPFDYSDVLWKEKGDFVSFGNDQLEENAAKAIVSEVWTQIKKKHPGKYSLLQILNVEENHDHGTGNRYLVELDLREISTGKSVRFSEYVYRHEGAQKLCSPVGVAWNKSAIINILLSTGNNQGWWILHFLNNMAKIHKRTKDFNFNVVIIDFGSKDIDIENALKKTAIPSYQYANIKDKFSRALGLQLAAEMVRDPNSILFSMDLHLDIPYHFLDDVRKHCIQHKIAYSPLLIRLACGATADRPLGHWEIHGLGLMGVYKSDWDKVGGMNVKEFKNKWGGEDWEMSDRILEAGMEIERLKMLHFFHYFHSKKGMWTDTNKMSSADVSPEYWH